MGDLEIKCRLITKYSIIIFVTICIFFLMPFLIGYSFDTVEPVNLSIIRNYLFIFSVRVWNTCKWKYIGNL